MIGQGKLEFDFFAGRADYTLEGEFKPSKVYGKKLFSASRCCPEYTSATCFLLYDDGTLYHGECLEDQPHGYGRIIHERHPGSDTFKHIGNWKHGKRVGQGLSYYNDKRIFLGNFVDDTIEEHGLMMKEDGTCSRVTYQDGEELSSFPITDNNDCDLLILGKKIRDFPYVDEVCDISGLENTELLVELGNIKEVSDYVLIEYDIGYCEKLHGKYCNNHKFYYGNVMNKLESNGTGYIKYNDGRVYYGDFRHNQKHLRGVMYYPNNTIFSGLFNFNEIQSGITLYPNKTVVATQEIYSGFMEFHFDLNKGNVECFHRKVGMKRNDCFDSKPERREDNIITSFKDEGRAHFGYEYLEEEGAAYTGQFYGNKYTGWGFLWKKYDPILIGKWNRNILHEIGMRITHTSDDTKVVTLGFWSFGKLQGPGLSIRPDRTIIGEFVVHRTQEREKEHPILFLPQDNKKFLQEFDVKPPSNIITDPE